MNTISIQVLSDLHLESQPAYDLFDIEPRAPYLALLGDIGNVEKHKAACLAFLMRQLRKFSAVFFVPGNHEAYHSSWPRTLAILRAFEEAVRQDPFLPGEFVLLDRAAYQVPGTGVAVLGCSLFSLVPPESQADVSTGMNDFYQIEAWDINAHNEAHRRDLAWLNAEVARLEGEADRMIILSHWSPSRDPRAVEPRYAGDRIQAGFSTDLSRAPCFTNSKVKAWASGHTHYNFDFVVERGEGGPLRLLANQRGYYFRQAGGFDGGKTVEI